MNIAVISNGTFSEEYYKEYFATCENTILTGVYSINDELPAEEKIDIIAVDYYNENIDKQRILYFSEQHPECLVIILADIDLSTDNFKKEENILKKFSVEYATCYNIKEKEYDAESFYDFAKIMIETKNECENTDTPFSANVIMWVVIFLAIVALGLIHYLH